MCAKLKALNYVLSVGEDFVVPPQRNRVFFKLKLGKELYFGVSRGLFVESMGPIIN